MAQRPSEYGNTEIISWQITVNTYKEFLLPLLQIIKIIPKQIHIQLKKYKINKKKKTKEEEAENSNRMGLWHFTPFLNKRAPN